MILHHYIWGDIDIDIVEEVAPHFLIAKHYGNLALFCRLTKQRHEDLRMQRLRKLHLQYDLRFRRVEWCILCLSGASKYIW